MQTKVVQRWFALPIYDREGFFDIREYFLFFINVRGYSWTKAKSLYFDSDIITYKIYAIQQKQHNINYQMAYFICNYVIYGAA